MENKEKKKATLAEREMRKIDLKWADQYFKTSEKTWIIPSSLPKWHYQGFLCRNGRSQPRFEWL
jgi:hypothetical protein